MSSRRAEPVLYEPNATIDTAKPLWVDRRLSPEEWAYLAEAYPELGALPPDAYFRGMAVLIMPPETRSQADLQAEASAAARRHYFAVPEYFISDPDSPEWVVVCGRGEGVGFITMRIYRLG